MVFEFDLLATTAIGCAVALFGQKIVKSSKKLQEWAIPAPVVGGLIIAILFSILRGAGIVDVKWDKTLSSFLMNVFFTCVGFGFSLKILKMGSHYVWPIFWTITLGVILQGSVGIIIAKIFGLHELIGVNATTGANAGGPGTAAAFGEMYEALGATGSLEAGVAAATIGLALGSLSGGPVSAMLIKRFNLKSDPKDLELKSTEHDDAKLDIPRLFRMVSMILIIGALGIPIQWVLNKIPVIEMPYFIGMLFAGAICRNIVEAANIDYYEPEIHTIESISLSIFLAITVMTMDLTQILHMLGPIAVMVVCSFGITILFAYFVVFRAYGKDYAAAVMTTGFIGTMMGSGTNAIANEQSLMDTYGYSHLAWVLFPAISVLAVDISNPLYMSLVSGLF